MRGIFAVIATIGVGVGVGVGCASLGPGGSSGGPDGIISSSDAAAGCQVFLSFDHPSYIAGPTTSVRAIANLDGAESSGVLIYTWSVEHALADVATTPAEPDGSHITFTASDPGVYHVHVDISGTTLCPSGDTDLNVAAPGADVASYRLRVIAPAGDAPPQEQTIMVPGGADYAYGSTALDPGVTAAGAVLDGASQPVSAYLKFMPIGAPGTGVETFTTAAGAFSATVVTGPQDVLVVPTLPGYAPRLVGNWAPTQTLLSVDAGTAITGSVVGPSGAALAGAKVQLELGAVPSTAATTDGSGNFTLAATLPTDPLALVTVEVVPAAATGLPRLTASSAAFDLTKPLQIRYAATVTTRSLASVAIRRGGIAVAAGTAVTIAGTLGAIGTVTTAGVTPVVASGTVAIATTTIAGGALPATALLAPAAPLSAVIDTTSAGGAPSVTAIDLTSSVPAAIDSAAPIATTGTAADVHGTPLDGVDVTATPDAALALAGAAPLVTTTAGGGAFTLPFAAGGTYDLRFVDRQGRAAPLALVGTTAASSPIAAGLPAALHISGVVTVHDVAAPIAGASVQVLCVTCAGVDLDVPLGEAASDAAGNFSIAVPDPGTMTVRHRASLLDKVASWALVSHAPSAR